MSYDFSKLCKYIDELQTQKGLPSGDVIVYLNGEKIFRYTVGSAEDDTLYYMFSCTKPITVVAGMQLVERGIINLEDPVSLYFPAYKNACYVDGNDVFPAGDKLKLRHLFTMSAGLNYNCETEAIKHIQSENPNASTLDFIPAFIENTPLSFKPGTKFQYSLCHDVLGGVIEVASGINFSEYLKKNIFEPLEMNDATFHITKEMESRLAPAYESIDNKIVSVEKGIGSFSLSKNYESGGASLVCTTEDYGKFAAAMSCGGISNKGIRILKSETVDLLRSPQMTEKHGFECAGGVGYAYGYGVRTLATKQFGAKSSIGEFGWDGAAGSYILMDPDTRVGIVYTQQVRKWTIHFGCMHAPIRDYTYEALGF